MATRKPRAKRKPAPKAGRRRRNTKPISFVSVRTGEERVLALDTSSRCVGWSVFDNGELLQHGRHVQQGETHGERLMTFRVWLLEMLAEFKPTRVIYEAPYLGRNGKTYGLLSRYVGVVEMCHFEHFRRGMDDTDVVAAKLVKRTIGAPKQTRGQPRKGKKPIDLHEQNKRVVLKLINDRFGLGLKYKENDNAKKTSQDDEADAIALNWAWHLLYRTDVAEAAPSE